MTVRQSDCCPPVFPMNLDKYKHQHSAILDSIRALKTFSKLGIVEHAADIARHVIEMSSVIKLHLAIENRFLYPALQQRGDPALAGMGRQYQQEMAQIAQAYVGFAKKWNDAGNIAGDPEGFRAEANRVLKLLHARVLRENRDFYPLIEQS